MQMEGALRVENDAMEAIQVRRKSAKKEVNRKAPALAWREVS